MRLRHGIWQLRLVPGGSFMGSGSFGLSTRDSGMCCGGSVLGLDGPSMCTDGGAAMSLLR